MEARGVRKFELAILGDFTLQLQTSKSLRKFPELDVPATAGEQDVV